MKICAVICEYNPFHNGHRYQLEEIRRLSGCDKILCIMSGNFTQRGDAAVFGKYTRARHAVMSGADAVIELPAAFATAPAELFARGAVHILASIPAVKVLAFGSESGNAEDFLRAARAMLHEDKAFRAALKAQMKEGTSYKVARMQTLLALNSDVDETLLTSPNNLLGTEYCRAILAENADMVPLPIVRRGAGYADTSILKDFSSATALRSVLGKNGFRARRALKRNLPAHVYADARNYRALDYEVAALCALLSNSEEEIALTPDCSEGLENRIRTMARTNPTFYGMLEKVVSKRYTRSRIKRIVMQNFLGIRLKEVKSFLSAPLYCHMLAVKKEGAEELLSALAQGTFPLIARKSDFSLLKRDALACFLMDSRANDLYNALSGTHTGDFDTQFV
ncbi:MAG: nucleotidyltransferase family protein [Clostridia bacterium]|nr:nucleotidyltransferase family protein [Clostridia bacterium]